MARANKRITAWDDQLVNTVNLVEGTQAPVLLAENVADPEKRGCTIVRMLIGIQIMPSNPNTANGTQRVMIGVGVTSDDAFSAGALPDLETDADFPVQGWMYRDSFVVVDIASGGNPGMVVRIEKDIRAQRKIDRSTPFLVLRTNTIQGSTIGVMYSGIVRILYKLP